MGVEGLLSCDVLYLQNVPNLSIYSLNQPNGVKGAQDPGYSSLVIRVYVLGF